MKNPSKISRRQFVGSAVTAAAASSLPLQNLMAFSKAGASPSSDPVWKDEGVLYVDKSPYAKLHNVPVHAVTIAAGFWALAARLTSTKVFRPWRRCSKLMVA